LKINLILLQKIALFVVTPIAIIIATFSAVQMSASFHKIELIIDNETYAERYFAGSEVNLEEPYKTGYTFTGWYNNALTTQVNLTIMPDRHVRLYAKFSINQYTIRYEVDGGTPVESFTQDYNKVIPQAVTEKTGHTFLGWYYYSSGVEGQGEFLPFLSNRLPAYDITLYAKWEINEYKMRFVTLVSDQIEPIEAPYGTKISLNSPIRVGYTFGGWYEDLDYMMPYSIDTIPARDITLYAKWDINQYTMSFNTQGGNNIGEITQDYQTKINVLDPTKEGYTFMGWYKDSEFTVSYTIDTMPARDITLYAKWNINQYTMSFDTQGGNNIGEITQDYETSINVVDPTKEGYTFMGWYEDSEFTVSYDIELMPSRDITLYARWEINQYTMIFNTQGGSNITTIKADFETKLYIEDPTKEGYTFKDWYEDLDFTISYVISTMPARDLTLYAKWEPNLYTITYLNALNNENITIDIKYDSTLDLPEVFSPGHIFLGWFYYDELFQSGIYQIADDIELVANWYSLEGDITYFNEGEYLKVISYEGLETIINIPDSIYGVPIKVISENVFKNNETIEEIYVGNNVTHIEAYAFSNIIKLKIISIGEKASNLNKSFLLGSNNLEKIVFPGEINLPLTEFINDDVLNQIKSIHLTTYNKEISNILIQSLPSNSIVKILDGIEVIPSYSFSYSQIETVILPSSVKRIEAYAFANAIKLRYVLFEEESSEVFFEEGSFYYNLELAVLEIPQASTVEVFLFGREVPGWPESNNGSFVGTILLHPEVILNYNSSRYNLSASENQSFKNDNGRTVYHYLIQVD
jgi:uncharacterized repeat protein (TIGR02543 family)